MSASPQQHQRSYDKPIALKKLLFFVDIDDAIKQSRAHLPVVWELNQLRAKLGKPGFAEVALSALYPHKARPMR